MICKIMFPVVLSPERLVQRLASYDWSCVGSSALRRRQEHATRHALAKYERKKSFAT